MLDLDLNIERGNSSKFDGDPIFVLLLLHAVLEGLPWFRETSRRLGVYALQDSKRVEVLVAVVEVIS